MSNCIAMGERCGILYSMRHQTCAGAPLAQFVLLHRSSISVAGGLTRGRRVLTHRPASTRARCVGREWMLMHPELGSTRPSCQHTTPLRRHAAVLTRPVSASIRYVVQHAPGCVGLVRCVNTLAHCVDTHSCINALSLACRCTTLSTAGSRAFADRRWRSRPCTRVRVLAARAQHIRRSGVRRCHLGSCICGASSRRAMGTCACASG